ncbi:cell division protein FtsX [Desulfovibrio inopinatus]|uniref:cell division protein FtsX n=1 Tax=Desulfovibrio inopinatus TaxID=102109 RepID=UPI0003FDCF4D|nr:permease-like cell division protein FtsX [Desulfovibrio inopinatus]
MIGYLLGQCVRQMVRHPWPQLLTLAAVTLTAFLSGLFVLFLYNLDAKLIKDQGTTQFQVYWKTDASMETVLDQWAAMRQYDNIVDVITFTPEAAFETLEESLGEKLKEGWIGDKSPLPPTALLNFKIGESSREWSRGMYEKLKSLPGVETVRFNPMQLDLANSLMGISQTIIMPLIGFLVLLTALVVGNTVRLSLVSRADEVEILHLIGARDFFIQLPLLAGGAVLGFIGGSLALILLKILQHAVQDMLYIPPLWIRIDFIPLPHAAIMVGLMTAVALLSSYVAVRR